MRALRAQAAVEVRLTLRRGESVLVALALPALLLAFFSLVRVLPAEGDRPVDFLLPGALSIGVMGTAMVSAGIAAGFERRYLVLKRLGGTPLSRPALLGAKGVAVLAVEVLQVAALLAVAVVLGWSPRGTAWGLAGAILLGTLAFGGLGFLLAGTLRAETNLAATNGLFLVLLLISGGVVPLGRLPDALAFAARLLPAAPLTDILRWSLGGGLTGSALPVLAAWAVAAPLAAALTFRWE